MYVLGGLYLNKTANSLSPTDIPIGNQCVRVLKKYCHEGLFLFAGFKCEKHICFFHLFGSTWREGWALQMAGRWSKRQGGRLPRESRTGPLSHRAPEHQGANMTTGKVGKRKAGLWVSQNLNVLRPRDSLSSEGWPTREKDHDSLLCALLSWRKPKQVWVCVNTGVVAGVRFACGVRCVRGRRVQEWGIRND